MNKLFLCLGNEFSKSFINWTFFKTNALVRMINMAITFSGFMMVYHRGAFSESVLSGQIFAFSFWVIGFYLFADMSWALIDEMQAGTLEQVYMSRYPSVYIWFSRMTSSFCIALFNVLGIVILLKLIFGVTIAFSLPLLFLAVVLMPELIGIAFFLGGLTMRIKKTEALVGFIYTACLYLSGAIVPFSAYPALMQRYIAFFPAAQGIALVHESIARQMSLLDLVTDIRFFVIILHSLTICGLGIAFFRWSEKRLRRDGNYAIY